MDRSGRILARSASSGVAAFLALVSVLSAVGCGREDVPGAASASRPRNVLLIVADTLRANRLGCYGYPRPTSPNIDRLASRGTLYRRNYSQACWTLPSMVSLMTGRSVVEEIKALPPDVPVLGEFLQARGFETAAFVANGVLGRASGFQRGFEVYQDRNDADGPEVAGMFAAWHRSRMEREASAETRKPFFAWIQFIDPHHPYEPGEAHDVFHGPRLDEDRVAVRLGEAYDEAVRLSAEHEIPSLEDSIAQASLDSNRYDGEVLAVDDGVGLVLARLAEAGELDDTLVILCADHGEMLYEHRLQPIIVKSLLDSHGELPDGVLDLFGRGHRPWYYDDLWNTPLIVSGPGMPSGVVLDGLTANLDIGATILDALGLPYPDDQEGRSLWGGKVPGRDRVLAYGHETNAIVEVARKKLILYPRKHFLLPEDAPAPVDLFDLAADPREETDLAEQDPVERDRLLAEIERWRERTPKLKPLPVSAEQQEALKRLGYVDGDH